MLRGPRNSSFSSLGVAFECRLNPVSALILDLLANLEGWSVPNGPNSETPAEQVPPIQEKVRTHAACVTILFPSLYCSSPTQ